MDKMTNAQPKRVVSLIASATEIVCALGANVRFSAVADIRERIRDGYALRSRHSSASMSAIAKQALNSWLGGIVLHDCAIPFSASSLMKSVSRATKASSIFRLNGGCANCSRLRTNTLH
jgi:hypothetical protein